jgi:hypothetical protein
MKFALIQLAEFVHLFGVACLGTPLFLGGWLGPGPQRWPVWLVVLKALALPARGLGAVVVHPHPGGPDPGAVREVPSCRLDRAAAGRGAIVAAGGAGA